VAARDERHTRRHVAMSERDAGVSRRRNRRQETRHDLERNTRGGDVLRFFRASSEQHRVAALQSYDGFSGMRELDELRCDPLLRRTPSSAALADVSNLGVSATRLEKRRMRESVVEHDVGGLERLEAADGDERWIAGAGSDE